MQFRQIALPATSLIALLLIWQLAVALFKVPIYLLPAPIDVWLAGAKIAPTLPKHLLATLTTVTLGFALSVSLSVPLGIGLSINRAASEAVYPLLIFANAVPVIAVAPIIVVIFGVGLGSRLIIALMVCFFPITVATATGVLDTPREYLDLSRATGASFSTELLMIRLPHAAPFIFSGLKIGISLSVIGAVVGEFITSQEGLGYLIVSATTNFDLPQAIAAVVVLAMMSVILYQIILMVQRSWLPWSIKASSIAQSR
jgi:NitT/TauT family transport system permease protein